MKTITAYTDGSAVVKGSCKGHGGFGTYFPDYFGRPKAFSLGFLDTKTGRMEITALLFALRAMPSESKENIELIVYSDSEYVVKTFTENRIQKWQRDMFVGKKNVDLWTKVLFELNNRPLLKLTMRHIKSHQVEKERNPVAKAYLMQDPHIVGNHVADTLADHKRHINKLKSDTLI